MNVFKSSSQIMKIKKINGQLLYRTVYWNSFLGSRPARGGLGWWKETTFICNILSLILSQPSSWCHCPVPWGEEGKPQQFLVRATFSSVSRPSHLEILVLYKIFFFYESNPLRWEYFFFNSGHVRAWNMARLKFCNDFIMLESSNL